MKLFKHCGYYLTIRKHKSEWESYMDPNKMYHQTANLKSCMEVSQAKLTLEKRTTSK